MSDELVEASGIEVPKKVFFRIGEVSDLTGVKAYVLRFWEKEFSSLRPKKSKSGQRRYRRDDILEIARIKTLLWDRKFTIQGARDELKRRKKAVRKAPEPGSRKSASEPAASSHTVKVQTEMLAAREQLSEARALNKELQERLAESRDATERARSQHARVDGEVTRLAAKLEASEADLHALRVAHEQLQARHQLLSGEEKELRGELERLRAQPTDSSAASAAGSEDLLRGELLSLRGELLKLRERLGARLPTLA